MPQQLSDLIFEAIIKGIRRTGEAIFDRSQQTDACFVPRDKGTLAKSGYTKPLPDGIEIGYSAPYSARVEVGGPFIPFSGIQIVKVKQYHRNPFYRQDGVLVGSSVVKAHERRYVDKRIVGFRPKLSKFERGPILFRVLRGEPERKGVFFLTRAVQEKIGDLSKNIEFYLKQIPGVL